MSLLLSTLLVIIFIIPGFLGTYFYIKREQIKRDLKRMEQNIYAPKVSVLLPFKGVDYDFENTVKSLLNQDYEGEYEVLFVSSDTSGKAVELINKYTKNSKIARLITVSKKKDSIYRSDKVNNLLSGISNASLTSEVYMFIDSDIVPHKKWISKMVQPLKFKDCGLSSGGAWIVSKDNSIFSLVARYWDFLATTYVTFPITSFARGFSFAIRKEVFESIGMKEIWTNAFHDNFPISKVVKKNGFKIFYAPDCLVTEGFDIKGFEWVRWIKRQTINTKVNYRHLFLISFIFVSLPGLIGGVGFFASIYLALVYKLLTPIISVFLIWPLIHAVMSLIVINSVYPDRKMYPDYSTNIADKSKLLLCSFIILLYYGSAVWALLSNKMEWRSLVYNQKSPFTTVVIEDLEKDKK